jgi:H+/Cl- antiporter ClcA/CBS domain-containing protein
MFRNALFQRLLDQIGQILGLTRDWYIIAMAAVVGIATGLVAVGFGKMVTFSEEFFFGDYSQQDLAVSLKLMLLIVIPCFGGLLVGVIQYYIQRAPPSHGIPDIIEALVFKHGVLRPRMGFFTAVKSSITIGSGGSTGVEGPIVTIGSVLGSFIGQTFKISRQYMPTLVGCGAAAGLACLFNAPIAAAIFVLEVMLRDFSLRSVMPIILASVFGTAVAHAVSHSNTAIFSVSSELSGYPFAIKDIWLYAILGVICGLTAYCYTITLRNLEEWWVHRVRLHPAIRPAAGGLVLGVSGAIFVLLYPHAMPGYNPPAYMGNGYPVIVSLLEPGLYDNVSRRQATDEVLATQPTGIPLTQPAYPVLAPTSSTSSSSLARDTGRETRDIIYPPGTPLGPQVLTTTSRPSSHSATSSTSSTRDAEHGTRDSASSPPTLDAGHGTRDPAAAPQRISETPPQVVRTRNEMFLFLILLVFLKIAATGTTLGSGGSGGIFAPSLFIGAAIGGGVGVAVQILGLADPATVSPATFALAGMAGVLAGAVHCPMTAFLLIFEITRDYNLILPVMLVSVIATSSSTLLLRESIYTTILREKGVNLDQEPGRESALLRQLHVDEVELVEPIAIDSGTNAEVLIEQARENPQAHFVLIDEKQTYLGMILRDEVTRALLHPEALSLMIVDELARTDLATVLPDDNLETVLAKLEIMDLGILCVLDEKKRPLGLVTRAGIMRRYKQAVQDEK